MSTEIHAATSERVVLITLMMVDSKHWNNHWSDMHVGMFLDTRHKLIFSAISDLYAQNVTPDPVTMFTKLQLTDHEKSVSEQYIMELMKSEVVSLSSLQYHIQTLSDCYKRREGERVLLQSLASIRDRGTGQDASETLDSAITEIINISAANSKNEVVGMHEGMKSLVEEIERRAAGTFDAGLKSNLVEMDKLIGSFEGGDLVVIGGRPSMGKTTLLQVLAVEAAMSQNKPCLVMSLEMKANAIRMRFMSYAAKIGLGNLRSAQLNEDQWGKFGHFAQLMQKLPIDINDKSGAKLADIRESARKTQNTYGSVGAIFVDYLQLVESDTQNKTATENERIGNVSKGLKAIAKDFNCPVFALSQLNRESEKRKGKEYKNSDLRASGQIEQDADVIIFVHRDDFYEQEKDKKNGLADLLITKQRNGELGTATVLADLAHCGFRNNENWVDCNHD